MFILRSLRMKTWVPPTPTPTGDSWYLFLIAALCAYVAVSWFFFSFSSFSILVRTQWALFIWKLLSFSFILKVCITLIFLPSSFFSFLVRHLSFSFWAFWTTPLIFILFFTIFPLCLCCYLEGEFLNFYLPISLSSFHFCYHIFSFSSSLLCLEFS